VHIDGGCGANNPSMVAFHEACKVWSADEIGCIVSLGTGLDEIPPFTVNMKEIGVAVVNYLTSRERIHSELMQLIPLLKHPFAYYRFDPTVPNSTVLDIDNNHDLEKLIEAADTWLREEKQKEQLEACVHTIMEVYSNNNK